MKISYDLHIHTALSPCGHEDMTPNNIVNMSKLCGVDVIAITDHNTCENVEAVMKVALKSDLIVIPGMEIESREEVHLVCLFPTLDQVQKVQAIVYSHLPNRPNNRKIFGEQILFNDEDDPIGTNNRLLSFACDLSLEQVVQVCLDHDGVCIPAHIDRPSYSIISNLGMMPENIDFPTLEISRHNAIESYIKEYPNHQVIQNSDAHDLGYIGSCKKTIDVSEKTLKAILTKLKSPNGTII
ncbi:PHP domain-containing protein [Petrocella sp. FN5]|uniref:PHP domain-containing protein n=1 Tax=Petrocella sp. FN5 TaxID=3032002 RepID=UPI0023D9A0D5|nr:PHP domain-containing protein [Petrocella sp. FN5]MDF1615964.1 PHP domain-containing protein [Petrocella sp. FN5]